MTTPLDIEYPTTALSRQHRRRQNAAAGPTGRVPRLARLLALAIKLDALVGTGTIRTYADLARLGYVSRARISQVLNFVRLAPTSRRPFCSCLLRAMAATRFRSVMSCQSP